MRLALLSVVLLAACNARTEILVGTLTDLPAPSVLDEVQLDVAREGVPIVSQPWSIPGVVGEPYVLPGSYGLYDPGGATPQLEVTLTAYKSGAPFLARSALVTLVAGKTLFMRLALVAACRAKTCAAAESCVEGVCRPRAVDAATFPLYVDGAERALACASGTTFIDTSTGAALPVGAGCAANQTCVEGTCYNM